MPMRIQENWIVHTLLVGFYTVTMIVKNSLLVSYKTDYVTSNWPNSVVGHLSPRNENICSPKNTYTIIQSRPTHNCQEQEMTQTFFMGDWLNILGVQPHQGILLSNKLLMHTPTWINFYTTFWVEKKKANPKRLCIIWFMYMTFLKL